MCAAGGPVPGEVRFETYRGGDEAELMACWHRSAPGEAGSEGRLYRRVGFEVIQRFAIDEKPLPATDRP